MSMSIYFIVWGDPKAEKRHRSTAVKTSFGWKARSYSPRANHENKACIRKAAVESLPPDFDLLDGPLELTVVCWMEQPESKKVKNLLRQKTEALLKKLFPVGKPDCDNLVKPIKDACNKVVWTDDARVVSEHVYKRYTSGRPCTEVWIRPVGLMACGDPIRLKTRLLQDRPGPCVLGLGGMWTLRDMQLAEDRNGDAGHGL